MKLLSVGLSGTTDEVRDRLRQDCLTLGQEGFRVGVDEMRRGAYTFLGCNVTEGELSFRNYERLKELLRHYVARILADWIVNREEQRLLGRMIDQSYGYFDEDERSLVLARAVALLEGSAGGFTARERHDAVFSQVLDYLGHHHELVVEGFVQFRLKEYRRRLAEAVDRAVDSYLLDLEYREFIRVLRYFVEVQEPQTDEVHVLITPGSFRILDGDGRSVSNRYADGLPSGPADGVNYEDILISALITAAPQRVTVHAGSVPGTEAEATLRSVFGPRMRTCLGCRLCRDS